VVLLSESACSGCCDSAVGEPVSNVGRVEAHVFADLVERDAALVDQASHEPDIDSEALGQATNVDERAVFLGRFVFCCGRWRGEVDHREANLHICVKASKRHWRDNAARNSRSASCDSAPASPIRSDDQLGRQRVMTEPVERIRWRRTERTIWWRRRIQSVVDAPTVYSLDGPRQCFDVRIGESACASENVEVMGEPIGLLSDEICELLVTRFAGVVDELPTHDVGHEAAHHG